MLLHLAHLHIHITKHAHGGVNLLIYVFSDACAHTFCV